MTRSLVRLRVLAPIGVALAMHSLASLALMPAAAQPESTFVHYRRLDVPAPWGQQRVLVTYPRRDDHLDHPPGERYPIVVALHGRGEAIDGPERGFLGWAARYGLPDAFGAIARGRLGRADYRGFVRDPHLEQVNASLRAQPFRGVMVVTPYIPDIGSEAIGSPRIRELSDWLAGPLIAAVRERFEGAARTRAGTGIDGVSLGGRVALEVGFGHPEVFGAVGAIQPAIRGQEADLAVLAETASRTGGQTMRLLSSDDDPFLNATRRFSRELATKRLNHSLIVVPGPHDYAFNRGPGSLELLLFHDRALAHEPFAN